MTEMLEDRAAFELPPVLDLLAAARLLEAFLERRGTALNVDGAEVQRLGAQCLQVLLAARAAWARDGQTLLLQNCSEDFTAALELMGVEAVHLTHCGTGA